MERRVAFSQGENYHLFTRGVEKRIVFDAEQDYERFSLLLFLSNSSDKVHMANLINKHKGESLMEVFGREDLGQSLVHILAYSLMPNHIHLIVQEHTEGGISRFMLKLMTAYSMYFNAKNGRSGPLFTRPFRSRHIDDDEYFMWLFSYVTLNPLELHQADWKENGIRDLDQARRFMRSYRYSSFHDYFLGDRSQSRILAKHAMPHDIRELSDLDTLLQKLQEVPPDHQHKGEPFM